MKVYVTEMPKQQSDCPFCQNGECGICHYECIVEKCCCLEEFKVVIVDIKEKEQKEKLNYE